MTKIFYDKLIVLDNIEKEIGEFAQTREEKEELWGIVDELVHHKVLGCILDALPRENHKEFLDKFHKAPYDEALMEYLKEKIGKNAEELIRQEIGNLAYEILQEIKNSKK